MFGKHGDPGCSEHSIQRAPWADERSASPCCLFRLRVRVTVRVTVRVRVKVRVRMRVRVRVRVRGFLCVPAQCC